MQNLSAKFASSDERRQGIDGVRLRNAWHCALGNPNDFAWAPDQAPDDFRREERPPTEPFRRIVQRLRLEGLDDWTCALRIAAHLTERARDRGPIQSDLYTTYRSIRRGYGYCADYAKVFVALIHAAGLFARRWSFTHHGFGGNGHVVVEVYDRARARWLFIDVHNNFHVVDRETREPLGALELRDSLYDLRNQPDVVKNGLGRPGYVHPHKLWEYYRRGAGEWYLINGNAVFSAEASPFVRVAVRMHPVLGQLTGLLFGVQPGIRILVTAGNRAAAERLQSLGRSLRRATASSAALCIAVAGLWWATGAHP